VRPSSSRFLRLIDKQTPAELDLHLILDNYAAHKTEAVKRWLARHPRFYVHFTPTSASWINAVEGLFATLTKRRLKRGVFRSVIELNRIRCMQGFKNIGSAASFCRSYDELRNLLRLRLRLRTRHHQPIPAFRRRLLHLRRATAALAILEAA
jgi:transposase